MKCWSFKIEGLRAVHTHFIWAALVICCTLGWCESVWSAFKAPPDLLMVMEISWTLRSPEKKGLVKQEASRKEKMMLWADPTSSYKTDLQTRLLSVTSTGVCECVPRPLLPWQLPMGGGIRQMCLHSCAGDKRWTVAYSEWPGGGGGANRWVNDIKGV